MKNELKWYNFGGNGFSYRNQKKLNKKNKPKNMEGSGAGEDPTLKPSKKNKPPPPTTKNTAKPKTNKKGLGASEVAVRAISPDP